MLLMMTDSRVARCCGRPIWRNENHKIDPKTPGQNFYTLSVTNHLAE
jgi:hypothetical protein